MTQLGQLSAALTLLLVSLGACSREKDSSVTREPSQQSASTGMPERSQVVPATHVTKSNSAELARGCDGICDRAAKLGCKRASACQANCVAMASTGLCETELGAFYACLREQPGEHWECLEDGTAAIREGYCENEQAAFARCLQEP